MGFQDVLFFTVFVGIMVAAIVYIRKDMEKQKEKYKKAAYRLLEESNPSTKELRGTMKCLHRYSGWRSKDEEAKQLIQSLLERIKQISG